MWKEKPRDGKRLRAKQCQRDWNSPRWPSASPSKRWPCARSAVCKSSPAALPLLLLPGLFCPPLAFLCLSPRESLLATLPLWALPLCRELCLHWFMHLPSAFRFLLETPVFLLFPELSLPAPWLMDPINSCFNLALIHLQATIFLRFTSSIFHSPAFFYSLIPESYKSKGEAMMTFLRNHHDRIHSFTCVTFGSMRIPDTQYVLSRKDS